MKSNYLFSIAAIGAVCVTLVSCEAGMSQEINLSFGEETESASSTKVFHATIDDSFSQKPATRTVISSSSSAEGGYTLSWEVGDEISISEGDHTAIYVTEEATNNAKFSKKSGYIRNDASKYLAFYPSNLSPSNQKLPATQDYVAGNVKNYPMYAESGDQHLSFKNLCGIIRLSVKNTEAERSIAVKSISVSVDGMGLSGEFTIDDSYAAVVSGSDGVVLNCATAVPLVQEASDFNIIIPKGNYNGMKIKITSEDGTVVNLVGQSAVTIHRSGITKVNIRLKASDFTNSFEVITFSESDVEFTER